MAQRLRTTALRCHSYFHPADEIGIAILRPRLIDAELPDFFLSVATKIFSDGCFKNILLFKRYFNREKN